MFINEVTKKAWPRYGIHKKTGARARFDCAGDMGQAYRLEEPLPEGAQPMPALQSRDDTIEELQKQLAELRELVTKKAKA